MSTRLIQSVFLEYERRVEVSRGPATGNNQWILTNDRSFTEQG